MPNKIKKYLVQDPHDENIIHKVVIKDAKRPSPKYAKRKMLATILQSVREYKLPSFLAPLFVTLESLMECIMPFVIATLINYLQSKKDVGMQHNDMLYLIGISAILVVLAMLSLLFGYLAGKYCAIASCGLARNLRKDLYHQVQEFSFENIDKFSSSSLVTRLTTDVNNMQMAYNMGIRMAFRVPLMMTFSAIMAFVLGGKVALIFVALIPAIGIVLYIIVRLAMKRFNQVFTKYDALNASVQENINGIRVVKTYVREDFEKNKFQKAADDVCLNFVSAEKIVAWNSPTMQFAMYTATILVSLVVSRIIITSGGKTMNIGNLTSLLQYGIQILSSLMMLSMIFVTMSMSIPSMQRIAEVLNEKSTLSNPINPVMEVKNGDVEFRNVSFKYSLKAEKNALSNINLKISSGETVGIIGGTGSSKTTLVNLISRLYDATEGEVLVGGLNVKEYDLTTLRNQVSVVLQKNVLFSGTIKENLRWGDKDATDEEIVHACKLACADEFVETFPDRYDTMIDQGGTNVSGGQKQRLCIARALLKHPKILILDDSTSAVDTKTDATIRKAFKENIPNITKFIISQRISSVQDADKIIVLDDGHISGIGTHDELLKTNQIYQEVYEIQNKIGGAH